MTDPLIARLDALAAANATAEYRFVDGQYIAFTSALHDAWPEIRARLEALSTVTDAMVDAALAAEDEAMEPPGYSDRSMMRAAIRAAYDAANAKGTG